MAPKNGTHPETNDGCARCKELEGQLNALRLERQSLVEQVALERSRADALYVAFPAQARSEADHAAAQAAAALKAESPLRYQVADAVNDAMKRMLPGAHRLMRTRSPAKVK
jgi:hypothetical protein